MANAIKVHIENKLSKINPENVHYTLSMHGRARILVRVTTYRRWRIGRDGHLDQFGTYDYIRAQI